MPYNTNCWVTSEKKSKPELASIQTYMGQFTRAKTELNSRWTVSLSAAISLYTLKHDITKIVQKVQAVLYIDVFRTVSDGEGSCVSGSIQSIKMYSCAQCAMQEKSMCCRDVPCLAHLEQGPDPLQPEPLPLPYQPGYWGLKSTVLVALNKDGTRQCSGHLQAAQPRTCGPRKVYVNIVL
jgi:hypothetical protein